MDLDKVFNIAPKTRQEMPRSIMLAGTIDPHVHCRPFKTGQMKMVVEECAREHEAIIDIPNVSGIKTEDDVRRRKMEILQQRPLGSTMQVGITPLVSNRVDIDMVHAAWDKPDGEEAISGVKVFWQGVSNDYGNSISCADAIKTFVESTTKGLHHKRRPLPITLHAECLRDYDGNIIPIKDREWWCIRNEVDKIIRFNPEGTYVIRHISDYRTIEWIKDCRMIRGVNIHGEISPQYLTLIDDDIFMGEDGHAALQCNCVFWPRPKDKQSRNKIRKAALGGYDWLHIGTDYAMHLDNPALESGVKINSKGIAVGGLNFLPRVAKSLLIDFFVSHNKAHLINPMLSGNAAKLYGITLSGNTYEYARDDWFVDDYSYGEVKDEHSGTVQRIRSANFLAGHIMHWQRA